MQFKNIVITIAAFAVAGAIANPIKIVARDVSEEFKSQMTQGAYDYLRDHATDKVTADDVAAAQAAAAQCGECWWGCDQPPLVVDEPCTPVQRYYLGCWNTWPDDYEDWSNTFNVQTCNGLNILSCNSGGLLGIL
ncbi:hypothetical protein CERZMDRAFT_102911 [Cercospora zeae-maydis SCOH1-5]|uniref:Uncharacterized protein n=1 Tax=Cercospora zeae-maydis SCOH1-5 TaxID=717836 RepID=A0A6A6EXK6_9PEZI|nr:hypothetical protein CERZMDRAFT_102911 [Cercospora zeae-maydis SCOH1-5]